MMPQDTLAIWFGNHHTSHPALDRNLDIDVAVVGGGIMGLTAAVELAKVGKKVALFERRHLGSSETGHTTAHVTARPETPMAELVKQVGTGGVTEIWQAMNLGLNYISEHATEFQISSALVDAWQIGRRHDLESELEVFQMLGANAEIAKPPAPFPGKQGLCLFDQMRFDIAQYLRGLTECAQKLGVQIFEKSAITDSHDHQLEVQTSTGTWKVNASKTILATGAAMFASPILLDRIRADQSYAIAVAVAAGSAPDVLAEDDENPYHYYRLEPGEARGHPQEDIVIFGGEDHKTGQPASVDRFDALEQTLKQWLPKIDYRVMRRWSGEIWTSSDGLPLIGEDQKGRFFGTGFAGVGMTQGTLAALMAVDWVLGKTSEYKDIFSPSRFSPSELPSIVQQGIGFVSEILKTVLPHKLPEESLQAGEGALISFDGQSTAAYRDLSGTLHLFDPKCTHAGCEVHWNQADSTWDCGCHGSRFTSDGEVRSGVALKALTPR
jgi:glycine/D-amino acid oxidase-like deaminating enzyme/nitrite reductase/ring-hydroxylating ferredoxin subunit